MVKEMERQQFEYVTDEDWKQATINSLRNLPFENLMTKTFEDIMIQPLYTKKSLDGILSNHQHFLQTIRTEKKSGDWLIAQHIFAESGTKFVEKVEESIELGNESIVYDGNQKVQWDKESLAKLAELALIYPLYAFNVDGDDPLLNIYSLIPTEKRKRVHGVLLTDASLPNEYHFIRTECADTIAVHEKGAPITLELALILAEAAEKVVSFQTFNQFANAFFVRFAIDTHFFSEMAKIRAFRVLWRAFAKAFGEDKPHKAIVFSETSLRSFSTLDSYVNLLRAGNEAFSAVLGGTDVLTVHPHNLLTGITEAGVRHARNIQLVIKAETNTEKIIDPAGGSYFIDTLTKQFVDEAWQQFLAIEDGGGYSAYIASGELEKRLAQFQAERLNKLGKRETVLVGTNKYADLSEQLPKINNGINSTRLAAIYEDYRRYFLDNQPETILLTIGELKDFKARADFVQGFLAPAGIKTNLSPSFQSVAEAKDWIKKNDFDYGILCFPASNAEQLVDEFCFDFPGDRWIDAAGNFHRTKKEQWLAAGIAGFIYDGVNQIEKFTAIKRRWKEVSASEKA